ncbi:MAG: endo-1,4-beta-xylanase [Planctomycetota bacterium]
MIRFEPPQAGSDAFSLEGGFLFGPDGVPTQGAVREEDGLIVCERGGPEAAGLALIVDLDMGRDSDLPGPIGRLMLRTCLLPPRERPYLLSLELARARVMLYLNKLEDWGLFDGGATAGPDIQSRLTSITARFEEARAAFSRALVAHRAPEAPSERSDPATDALARRALVLAIDAGEQLALASTARELAPRLEGIHYANAAEQYRKAHSADPPAEAPIVVPNTTGVVLPRKPAMGVGIDPALFSPELQKAALASADFIALPLRWIDMEPVEGKYDFKSTDRWIEWAVRKARLPIVAGPVIDFRPGQAPEWLHIWENDYDTLRELVYEHVKQVVTRYRRTIRRWTVATALHVNTNFRLGFEQMMDLTRVSVLMVRKLHPQARIQLEIVQPWGEYHAFNKRSLPPVLYAEMVQQVGITVDAYALRLQMGHTGPGLATRDMMQLSAMLDRYAQLERPIAVTAAGAPVRGADGPGRTWWRGGWSPERQADWLERVAQVCLAKPFVHSFSWQDLAESEPQNRRADMPDGGLLDAGFTRRPAFERFVALREALREGRSLPVRPELP